MTKRLVDDGPNDAPVSLVDIDDELADYLTVAERDDARARLQPSIGDKTRRVLSPILADIS